MSCVEGFRSGFLLTRRLLLTDCGKEKHYGRIIGKNLNSAAVGSFEVTTETARKHFSIGGDFCEPI